MNDCLKEPALFVENVNITDIDLSLPPTSGEEYIKRVIIEAKKCESVVVAEIEESRLKKQTVNVKPLSGCIEAPESLSPTLEWQQCQIADFSDVRLRIAGLRTKIQNENCKWENPGVNFPEIEDQNGWINFCSSSLSEETSDGILQDGPVHISPTLGIVMSMSHPLVEQVLEYLVEFIESKSKIEFGVGQWVYALLAVIELPLNPDACSCLRTLARTCSIIRAHTNSANAYEVNTLNLFICLVARYFRQLDLADP